MAPLWDVIFPTDAPPFGGAPDPIPAHAGTPPVPLAEASLCRPYRMSMETALALIEKARTLESSGQDQAALDLYSRAAEESEEPDLAILVRMGNLQLRLGRAELAVESFSRAADHLAAAGLRNGAIAVWRRVLRVEPDSPPALLRLAELNAREGYAGEARDALARYAETMEKAGDADAALRALRAHVEAFPADPAARELLVERLAARGLTEEAREIAAVSPPEPPRAETAPEDVELEVLGSGWEGARDEPAELPEDPGIDLVPTRVEEDAPAESGNPPLAGLEPTLMEGLEPTSLEPEEPEDEPLSLLGSGPEAGWDRAEPEGELPEEEEEEEGLAEVAGGDLPLLGAETPPDEQDLLMRRVEEAVRSGDDARTAEALLALGRYLAAAGQREPAAEVFERVLELDPGNEEARRARAGLRSP